MIKIILDNDYEVNGDGSGNPLDLMVERLNNFQVLCDEYDIKTTTYVDILELMKFEEAEKKQFFGSDYKAYSEIKQQLINLKLFGNDIQLHLHPQWINAKPILPNNWSINKNIWRIPSLLEHSFEDNNMKSLFDVFKVSKEYLENIIKEVDKNYQCIAFRAGGHCIQPEAEVLKIMQRLGIYIDSNVCLGKEVKKDFSYYNFTKYPKHKDFWKISNSVTREDINGKLIELPIFTSFIYPPILRKKIKPHYINRTSRSNIKNNVFILNKIKKKCIPQRINFDYCKLNFSEMKSFLLSAIRYFNYTEDKTLTLVMTGHPKEWNNNRNFRKFIEWTLNHKKYKIDYITVSEWYKLYKNGKL